MASGSTGFPRLETERLVLRELSIADAPALLHLYADTEHMQWYGIDPLRNLSAAEDRIRALQALRRQLNPACPWAIETKAEPHFIGTCGLFAWNRNWRKCSVGYELARESQGRGFMSEALAAAIHWGFTAMELNRIEAQVHPCNHRSVALLRRLHFVEEGRLREAAYWGGLYHDMLQFALLRERSGA
jgi:ribosomal-protein-alanine N-acetyltransferase